MKKREIPIKNYIILAAIIISTVFITFHLANRYKAENDYYKNFSPLYNILYEIKMEELDNYLLENPNIIIYVVNGNDDNVLEMDKTIKNFVLENDLTNDIVVINATNNINQVTRKLNDILDEDLVTYKNNLLVHTNLFSVKDRIIDDILVPKTKDMEAFTSFFRKNGVI